MVTFLKPCSARRCGFSTEMKQTLTRIWDAGFSFSGIRAIRVTFPSESVSIRD